MTRLEYLRSAMKEPRWNATDLFLVQPTIMETLMECAEAVVQFSDLEPGYKGGAITEAAKKLMEEV